MFSMPVWFILPGVILSTIAAVIASQALISGSYTIISEAITLNFWPKVHVKYPTSIKGQLYIPSVNWLLLVACSLIVLLFQSSSNMAFGNLALDLILKGTTGRLVSLRNGRYDNVPIDVVTSIKKKVDVGKFYDTERYRPRYENFNDKPQLIMTSDY